jgi:hypothetical protein
VMLLQIERKLLDLEDGNALNGLDSLQYALRGKTVRIFQPGLVNVTANLYELQKQWSEEENIRVETVPSFHLQELERGTAALAVVLKLDLSGAGPAASAARVPSASAPAAARPIRVFVSYSHQDAEYVDEKKGKSLLAYLRGTLEDEGFSFWWDARLNAGDLWDDVIRKELEAADIALVLVSQYFLSSKYCKDVEAKTFVARRKAAKMVVFPVIVASCEWDRHEWLKSTQFEPREGQTVETHYTERGPREELYLKILKQLRAIGEGIRKPQP